MRQEPVGHREQALELLLAVLTAEQLSEALPRPEAGAAEVQERRHALARVARTMEAGLREEPELVG